MKMEKRVAEEKKAGVPYSKHKLRICHHFVGYGGGIIVGFAYPTLYRISEEKCKCAICKSEFPIDFMDEMEQLTSAFANAECCDVIPAGEALYAKSRLVEYYYEGPDQIHYVNINAGDEYEPDYGMATVEILSEKTGIPFEAIRTGHLTDEDWDKMIKTVSEMQRDS